MTLAGIALGAAGILLTAYWTYGTLLARLLRLDPRTKTPAVELRDDLDYVPTDSKFLLSQHFSAIAAAGPIVGPILAGITFGWLPALIWILVGSILIGGVHDLTALVASIRHKAQSIAEVVRQHMSQRSYLLFLSFIWIALVYIIVAFTDITAQSFVGTFNLESGEKAVVSADQPPTRHEIQGAAIATSSLIYLALPIIMGILLRYTKLSLTMATLIFVPLIGLAIYAGPFLPLDLESLLGISQVQAHKLWDVILLGYCLVAAVLPVWLLLQPRGHLGGYFLYVALAAGAVGMLLTPQTIQYPQFRGWRVDVLGKGPVDLFPMLFITIACGACSGFHSLIASGTTSKQLRVETDAKPIGYGAMLLEAMIAIISLSCVMILAPDSPLTGKSPNAVYANGIGSFVQSFGIPATLAASFALLAFSTFVFDTLDVCVRLGRFIIQELIGRPDWIGRLIGTVLTAGVPLYFVLLDPLVVNGKPQPMWRTFWDLFGASNQLLAALTLLGVTVWLWRTRRAMWVWLVTGIPTVWMYVMSSWALMTMTRAKFWDSTAQSWRWSSDPVAWAGVVLLVLAALMLVEAVLAIFAGGPPRRRATLPQTGNLIPAAG
ncbi:MAG: carbon starvation CstA family protein [Pirellulales bacterium]|nr:carbon starvation CstA family protein [Pirellulales bacterium]